MPEAYTIRVPEGPDDLKAYFAVRHEVFVLEQKVPADLEYDEFDATAVHVVAIGPDGALGAGRLLPGADGTGVLGRLAVLSRARGLGVGAALVRAVEEQARLLGLRVVELHAQVHALGFYERLGYEPFGEEYEEAGIAHRSMRRAL
ncbi:GNAT family N-acetyltransferase [Streptomyces sp. NPDC088354]|uniref:GNAT family N-acetyltransferase n=1 Tax=unclassified Streptomyces TaxID=2593676 RepID=UPI0029B9AE4D|nr:GNAT family N-acetyltransferase [Streptomyces sp. MI02-7b]MDX3074249.1 GNAT family N-acetyltransferase [Streptomyces sp. MI02-7b]